MAGYLTQLVAMEPTGESISHVIVACSACLSAIATSLHVNILRVATLS